MLGLKILSGGYFLRKRIRTGAVFFGGDIRQQQKRCPFLPQEYRSASKPLFQVLGFTLVELMITVAVIGALAAIAVPNYISSIQRARNTKCIADMKTIAKEIFLFRSNNGAYPESLADVGMAGLLDPWGNPYRYLNLATTKGKGKMRKDHFMVPINTDYDLYSMGPDGRSVSPLTSKLSRDDIIRASNGKYYGVASEY